VKNRVRVLSPTREKRGSAQQMIGVAYFLARKKAGAKGKSGHHHTEGADDTPESERAQTRERKNGPEVGKKGVGSALKKEGGKDLRRR